MKTFPLLLVALAASIACSLGAEVAGYVIYKDKGYYTGSGKQQQPCAYLVRASVKPTATTNRQSHHLPLIS